MHVGLGTFFQNPGKNVSDAEVYAHQMAMADQAEPLGFESIWCPEHHFDDYTMSPNPAQFLTYLAGRTKNVKLGSMVTVLPWHDPVRVAEEWSLLDNLSQGRAILGIGRGLAQLEFTGFRVDMGESRRRFVENAEAVVSALESGAIECDGEFYKQPRREIRPAPYASFKGRVYASAVSPISAEIMARLGIGILIIAQKPWDKTIEELDNYRAIYRDVNGEEAPKPILISFTSVHDDPAMATEMFEKYNIAYAQSALDHYEFDNEDLAKIEGYEYYGNLARNLKKHGSEGFCRFLSELQAWGTPEQVIEKSIENVRRVDGAGIVNIFSFGGMPFDLANQNMRTYAERVLPVLQAETALAAE